MARAPEIPWHEYIVFHEGGGCGGKIVIQRVSFNAEARILFSGRCRRCNRNVSAQGDVMAITQENGQIDRGMPLYIPEDPDNHWVQ